VGSVLAIGGPAISIAAGGLGIALRNVVIAPLAGAGGTHGVSMTGGSTLTIEHSLIANLPNRGVSVVGAGTVRIANSIIRNSGDYAVWLESGASGLISGTQMLGNSGGGVTTYGAAGDTAVTKALVTDSVISGGAAGVSADAGSGSLQFLGVTGCTIEGTDKALMNLAATGGGAEIIVSHSVIMNNNYAYYASGSFALIGTAGNNQMGHNNHTFGSTFSAPLQ
jgi:hypothetical protein